MKEGIIYMAWGANAIEQSKQSIRSLRQFEPDLPVLVVGDRNTVNAFSGQRLMALGTALKGLEAHQLDVDPFDEGQKKGYKFLAGRVKPLLDGISPFERTLYVDADTMFVQSPRVGFEKLDRWDMALAETETRCLNDGIAGKDECEATAEEFGSGLLLYHNSGMIFWKKNERTKALFEHWAEEWKRFGGWDEQVALLRALLRSKVLFLTLPYTWNHSAPRKAYLIAHWFGAGDARFDLKQRVRNVKAVLDQRNVTSVMARVKIAGGQYVKCKPGEEEEIRARLLNQSVRRKDNGMIDKGPMVKVMRGRGQYVKMYQKDAEALGLEWEHEGRMPKGREPQENKMREPGENKGRPETEKERLLRSARNDKITGESVDFTEITGVGKATNEKLHAEGIHTFEDLMTADVNFLPGAAKKAVEKWKASVS